mgnify:CR=1 FL=1
MRGADLFPVLAATWPQRTFAEVGPFVVPEPDAGGNRVSAARLSDASGDTVEALDVVEAAMEVQGRAPLFQVLDHQSTLEGALGARGYIARDHTDILVVEAKALAKVPPPVTAFDIWPPLAIQVELWAEGGIDAARLGVMHRAIGPKTSVFGRIKDQPAGAAYVAMDGDIAMLHALEITPHLRRNGLAAIMMEAAADWAVQNGAAWLSVLVTQENAAAQGLYASLGLKPVGSYHYREKREP